jgi:hypothetical protein
MRRCETRKCIERTSGVIVGTTTHGVIQESEPMCHWRHASLGSARSSIMADWSTFTSPLAITLLYWNYYTGAKVKRWIIVLSLAVLFPILAADNKPIAFLDCGPVWKV